MKGVVRKEGFGGFETKEGLIEQFKDLLGDKPSRQHPWVKGVENHSFNREQIIAAEIQHYLSVSARAKIYATTLWKAIRQSDDEIKDFAVNTVQEELTGETTHADILFQFLEECGISKGEALQTPATPGTEKAIHLLNDQLEGMTALECVAVMALPEWEYGGENGIATTIHKAYAEQGFSKRATGTFSLHAEVDAIHGNAYFDLLARKILEDSSLKEKIFAAMKLGRDAFILERDGQYQAASNDKNFHWKGLKPKAKKSF